MKILLPLVILTFGIVYCSQSQECDYNFKKGTVLYVMKGFEQTPEQKNITIATIEKMKVCLNQTTQKEAKYWLNNSIANHLNRLGEIDAVEDYTSMAFKIDTFTFCKEYISSHVQCLDEDFPFEKHFLDYLESEKLNVISNYCKVNYLEEALFKKEKRKAEKQKELESKTINHDYLEALTLISDWDQQERKKKNIDWEIQNELDSLNRVRLDELHNLYGAPTKENVSSEGVNNAFMVLHHSTDCKWNEKWTKLFLDIYQDNGLENIFSFYFFRNFNEEDGFCKENKIFVESIMNSSDSLEIKKLMDFSKWE